MLRMWLLRKVAVVDRKLGSSKAMTRLTSHGRDLSPVSSVEQHTGGLEHLPRPLEDFLLLLFLDEQRLSIEWNTG